MTRYRVRNGGLSFFSDIALLFIDEVHLLNDPRGAALEAIVSRIKMLARNPDLKPCPLAHVRLLAVSATIPNLEDLGTESETLECILVYVQRFEGFGSGKSPSLNLSSAAEWLMVPPQGIKRYMQLQSLFSRKCTYWGASWPKFYLLRFGEEMRPVKLTHRVLGRHIWWSFQLGLLHHSLSIMILKPRSPTYHHAKRFSSTLNNLHAFFSSPFNWPIILLQCRIYSSQKWLPFWTGKLFLFFLLPHPHIVYD